MLPQQRPGDYGIPMDVEVAYVQDSFLTSDVLQEMVSWSGGGGWPTVGVQGAPMGTDQLPACPSWGAAVTFLIWGVNPLPVTSERDRVT